MSCEPRASLRVFAMARPARCGRERELVKLACTELGASGSQRRRSREVAAEVARLALVYVRQDDADLGAALQLAEAKLARPAVAMLACDAEIDTASIVRAEAIRQFEGGGCRHLEPQAWKRADDQLEIAVTERLAERFRRALK